MANAADPKAVSRAERKARRREDQRLACYKAMLGTPEGRAVFWDLMVNARVFESIYSASGSSLYYNCGGQDFGHRVIADLIRADEEGYQLMEREARARQKRDSLEDEAAQTRRADVKGEQ